MKRLTGPILALLAALAVLQPPALADDIDDLVNMVAQTDIDVGLGLDVAGRTCPGYQSPPTNPNITYKTFVNGQGQTINILLDEYDPRGGTSPYPALVLAHGGGWHGGCRRDLSGLAWNAAGLGYIVFSIDYRLDCPTTDPTIDPEIFPLCGWTYPTPPADVMDAVKWARDHAADYKPWNGKVGAIGTSAGGHLFYYAGTVATGQKKPDVMAGLSGPTEMGYLVDGRIACTVTYPMEDQTSCTDRRQFMGFDLGGTPSSCQDNWTQASPYCRATALNLPPPAFIGNATEEHIGLPEATDFNTKLSSPPISVVTQLCTVSGANSHLHGTQLLGAGVKCDGSNDTVFTNMMNFIDQHT